MNNNTKKLIAFTLVFIMVLSGLGVLASAIEPAQGNSHITPAQSSECLYESVPDHTSTCSFTTSTPYSTIDLGQSITFSSKETNAGSSFFDLYYQSDLVTCKSYTSAGTRSYPTTETPSSTGSYTWYIEIFNDYTGCTNYISSKDTISVVSDPSVSISASASAIDVGQTVSLTSAISGGPSPFTYSWSETGASGSFSSTTSATPTWTASSTGTATFSLAVTTSSGYSFSSSSTSVSVYTPLSFSVSSSRNPSDAGQSITYSTTGSGGSGSYSYSYTLYDGTSSSDSQLTSGTSSSFSYTYSSSGSYLLDYSMKDSAGASITKSLTQTVNTDPSVSITSSQNPTDSGKTVEFLSSPGGGTAPYNYTWSADGSTYYTKDINVTFSSSGTYTIDLTVKDATGYSVSTSLSQTVNSDPTVSASSNVSSADINYPIEFSSSPSGGTGPYTYSWVLNGNVVSTSEDFSYSFSTSGSYTLTVTITDSVGTTTSASVTVTIHNNPSISISSSQNPADVGNSVTFSSTVSGGTGTLTYSWLVNGVQQSTSPSFSYSFSSAGTYYINVTVVDSDGHSASYSLKEIVNPDPSVVIHASHNPTDTGIAVNFTSSISGGTPGYAYSWTINGENYSTSYVDYTFTLPGTFSVSLQITDRNGNTASDQIEEVVNADPTVVVDAQYTRVDQGVNDTFYADVSGGSSPFNYTWSLGGQVLNYSQEFHLNFTSLGTYTINLTLVDSLGKTTSASIVVTVIKKPSAAIEGSNETDVSTSTYWEGYGSYGTAPYEYYWYINGVNTSSGLYLDYSFPKAGTYNISLLIIDADGAKAKAYMDISVNPLPSISISSSVDTTDIGTSIVFSSSISGGSPFYNYTWRISSLGFVGYQSSLTYDFTSPGTYNVTVEITDGSGNSASASMTVIIHRLPAPKIKAEYSNIDVNVTDSFNSNVTGGTAPYSYSWSINGVYEGNGTSLSYSFSTPGIYTVKLAISDSAGVKASYITDVSVQAYPVASIISSRSDIDANVPDTFRASGTGGVGPYTYEWIIGGHTFSNDTVSYSFASSGNYTVQLVIADSFGKDSSNTTIITVFPDPHVSVHWTGKPVVSKLFHMSANITGGIAPYSVSWIFPSGQHVAGLSISHVFSSSGPETFEVEVSDQGGYSGTTNYTIQVGLYVAITSSTRSGLGPLTVQFSSSVLGGSDYSYNWTFSPEHYSLQQNPEYTFPVGNYTVHFIVRSANGATGYANISIQSLPAPVTFSYTTGKNITDPFNFTAKPNWDAKGPYNMSWSFPNGQTLTGLSISYYFPVYNEFNTVVGTFGYNNQTYTEDLNVRMVPATPSISFTPPPEIPVNTILILNGTVTDPDSSSYTFAWDVNGTLYSGNDTSILFNSPGKYNIELTVTDSLGASNIVNKTVTVLKPGTSSSITISVSKSTSGPYIYFHVHVDSLSKISLVEAYIESTPVSIYKISGNSTNAEYNVTASQRNYKAGIYSLAIDVFSSSGASNSATEPFSVSSQYSSTFNIVAFFGGLDNMIMIILTIAGVAATLVFTRPKPTDINIDGTVLEGRKGKPVRVIRTPKKQRVRK